MLLKRYEFRYPLSKDEAISRLETAISAQNEALLADFSGDGVKVYREGGFLHNSFNPIFVGRFRQRGAGTVLKGYFRFHAFILLFVACLIGLSVYNLVEVLHLPGNVPGHVDGSRSERLIFELEFLGFAVLIPIVGWLVGLRSRNIMLSVITKSTSVHS